MGQADGDGSKGRRRLKIHVAIMIRLPPILLVLLLAFPIALDWTIVNIMYTYIARGMQAIAILEWTWMNADAMGVIDIGISSTLPYGAMQHIGASAIYSASSIM